MTVKYKFKPKIKESDLQAQCVQYFKMLYPEKIIFHIPNGGKRNKFEAARFKQQGVLSGVPDLFIPETTQSKHGLFIEMKSDSGRLSDNQRRMIERLMIRGYDCQICHSVEEFITTVKNYFEGANDIPRSV